MYIDVVEELEFFNSQINSIIDVPFNSNSLKLYKTYYWRTISYSENGSGPNSFTDLFTFTLIE
jgi:hypothetical protein